MAVTGAFDPTTASQGWADATAQSLGWFDPMLITVPTAAAPAATPKPLAVQQAVSRAANI